MSDSVSVPTGYGNITRVNVNLTITNASREDTGMYMCSASNSVGSDNKSINITVQCEFIFIHSYINFLHNYVVPAEIINDVADLVENERNPVTFSCQATGEPVPNIIWHFNGVMINTSNISKYNTSNSTNGNVITSAFTILSTQSSDVGNYTCYAENDFGNDQNSGVLTINGK